MGMRDESEEAAEREDRALAEISRLEYLCDSGYLNEDGKKHYHSLQNAIAMEYGLIKDDLGYHRRY